MSSLEEAEKLAAEGATEFRITLDYMKSQIAWCAYTNADYVYRHALHVDISDKLYPEGSMFFTICLMTLKNGFTVIGKSAPLSEGNFDLQKGRTFAYEDCIRQLWPLYAFAKKQGATL